MCYIDDDMYVVILHASIPEPESKPFWDTPAVESQRIYRTSGWKIDLIRYAGLHFGI